MEKPTKYYSSIQEHKVADALQWQVVTGSGAAPCVPGDVIGDNWLGECKTHATRPKPIYFNHDVWNKIKSEAIVKHRKPVLITDDGSQDLERTWCLCLSNSVEKAGRYSVPFNSPVRVNVSFNHDDKLADYRQARKIIPAAFSTSLLVFSVTWQSESVFIMPFSTFLQIVQEQG